ncbi:hypothetical protein HMN09_00396500 [Mycena chlorophos]|uniref:FAD/NAD(P)-binding domain-containing protein n=1 Tax=Mycena chlorophos TaxID=658473 RepID=A0A8H6TG47_MYCCL|nr:hypothetical protein HMN09_00396500 [Mycena chlorophos]
MPTVAVLGSGIAGLITAHVLSTDGFDVRVLTRDRTAGGQWATERIYPGLQLNTVHGEFAYSALPMPPPADASKTGGRLSATDLNPYMEKFAAQYLEGKIEYRKEIRGVSRNGEGKWEVVVDDIEWGVSEVRKFDKIVLCTGGTCKGWIPPALEPLHGLKARILHSAQFGATLGDILHDTRNGEPVVVIGGGKSAQDISALLAKRGRNVTIVYEKTDSFNAVPQPVPDRLRRGRSLAIFSPYPNPRSKLERFLHTTKLGGKIVRGMWNLMDSLSFKTMGVPKDSPLRLTYSNWWTTQFNDEGIPRDDGFHRLVMADKIKVVAPVRMTGYSAECEDEDKGYSEVLLSNGEKLKARVIVLCTGYQSTWGGLLDGNDYSKRFEFSLTRRIEQTAESIGLHRHRVEPDPNEVDEWASYTSLASPPPPNPDNHYWASSIYKGIVPAKNILERDFAINGAVYNINNGYTDEVIAHWISAYFLHDKLKLPPTPEAALAHTDRDARWFRKRWPSLDVTKNEAQVSWFAFLTWPQFCDELMEDMYLRSYRSGRNWLTWAFSVIDIRELATMHEERAALRNSKRT